LVKVAAPTVTLTSAICFSAHPGLPSIVKSARSVMKAAAVLVKRTVTLTAFADPTITADGLFTVHVMFVTTLPPGVLSR
jgi:hypothetical protein